MNFAVMGGDARFVHLCRLLRADGHRVTPFALDAAMPNCADSAEEAAANAHCVILPLPCVRAGRLNAPLSALSHSVEEILSPVSPGTPVCAGMPGDIAGYCARRGLPLRDYYVGEDTAVKNALLTAEGAVGLLLRESERSLAGSRVLICGFGRIGKMLAPRLLALGADVTVTARDRAQLAWAQSMGCRTLPLGDVGGKFDFVLNTVPATIFRRRELENWRGAWLIELASAPYGFDIDAAAELGLRLTLASGLPAATAPESAAGVIRDAIYQILEETT